MKNVMMVDGALNCAYDIFQMTEDQFRTVFPMDGQDIAFIEDIAESELEAVGFADIWSRPVARRSVSGIDGILYFGLPKKKEFYPNRRDSDLDFQGRAFSSVEIAGRSS